MQPRPDRGPPLCTERRIREAVRAACDLRNAAGPYWVRDGRDGPERALYVRRGTGRTLALCQSFAPGAPASYRDALVLTAPRADPGRAYATIAAAIEARGFTIAR